DQGLGLAPSGNRARRLFLAYRTIERRAPVLHDALDRAPAARRRALLAFPIVDAEVVLEHAEFAVGKPVIAERGAAVLDRCVEHCLDAVDEAFGALVRGAGLPGDRRGNALRRSERPVQGLADIDVAEASDDPLI